MAAAQKWSVAAAVTTCLLLMWQSGGRTAVINSSVAGVLQEAGRQDCIEDIYGGLNGILWILNEELIDIANQHQPRSPGTRA